MKRQIGAPNLVITQRPSNIALKYRSDIDGLRAVAVLSVIGCHLEIQQLTGGFVGVDVFFVISGYLISSIILKDIDNSCFSIRSFYARRIRRIFPALFFMLLVLTIFSLVYFMPLELVKYSDSLLATTIWSSNVYFWRHTGYFDSPTSYPLLHTWSLAVEEQFYVVIPIVLLMIHRYLRRWMWVSVVAMCIASFLLSVAIVSVDKNTAFYMPFTRAWELLMGTTLSLGMFPRISSVYLRNLLTAAGLAMIAIPTHLYDSNTAFPGLAALWPCLGTALIIGAGESGPSLVSALLSWRPIAFIGLISYSLYLWHWPMIVLNQMGALVDLTPRMPNGVYRLLGWHHLGLAVKVLEMVIVSAFSWRFVERPFRFGRMRLTGKPLFVLAGVSMAIFVAFSASVRQAGGLPGRFSDESVRMASYGDDKEFRKAAREGTCFLNPPGAVTYDPGLCLHEEAGKRNYLLIGDSHAAMLYPGFASAFPEVNIMEASEVGCGAFIHPHGLPSCAEMTNFVYRNYLPTHPIQGLLLSRNWHKDDLGRLSDTIAWAKEHKVPVVIIGPLPAYDAPLPRLEAYSLAWRRPGLARRHMTQGTEELDSLLESMAKNTWHVPYVSLYRAICNGSGCAEFADEGNRIPLMFDTNHLSPSGSLMVVGRLRERGELGFFEELQ